MHWRSHPDIQWEHWLGLNWKQTPVTMKKQWQEGYGELAPHSLLTKMGQSLGTTA